MNIFNRCENSYDTVIIGYPIWWHIAAWPGDGFTVRERDISYA